MSWWITLLITLILTILVGVVTTWIEPSLRKYKAPVFIFLIIIAFGTAYITANKIDFLRPKISLPKRSTQIDWKRITITDADGRIYKTFQFKNLIWMSENLALKNNASYCYKEDESNGLIYGRLYSFDSGLLACKSLGAGWRLPKFSEFTGLLLNNDGGYKYQEGFYTPETYGNPEIGGKNLEVGGAIGFNALKGGYMSYNPIFPNQYNRMGESGIFWIDPDVQNNEGDVYCYETLNTVVGKIDPNSLGLKSYFSCRCVIDTTDLKRAIDSIYNHRNL